jgi:hypothetical protein
MIDDEMVERASDVFASHMETWPHIDITRAALTAALSWRPIETAPKDVPILLLYEGIAVVGVQYGDGMFKAELDMGGSTYACHYFPSDNKPTHYLPLPPASGDAK